MDSNEACVARRGLNGPLVYALVRQLGCSERPRVSTEMARCPRASAAASQPGKCTAVWIKFVSNLQIACQYQEAFIWPPSLTCGGVFGLF